MLPFYYILIAFILFLAGVSLPWIGGYILASLATAPLFVRGKDLLESKLLDKKKRSTLLDDEKFVEQLEKLKDLRSRLFHQ